MKANARKKIWLFGVAASVALIVILAIVSRNQSSHKAAPLISAATATTAATAPVPTTNSQPASSLISAAGFQKRPFAVARASEICEWTAEDGKDTNVIRRLAHNDLEVARMIEENPRILRRQLVYRKDTAAAELQRAKSSGNRVTQLTIPGFDGQELQVEIERADLEPSWQSGTFTGRLVGKQNSMVTLAFKFGREAFTVMSPDDGTYFQAWPREPGEIMLTSFDPATYQSLRGGEPIRTAQK